MTHKLLIIDDHPETLDIISRVLRNNDYAVLATSSALQGLALAGAERPDLILLDGMMPEMDGWELCRRIRASEEIAATPIIMFSAVNVAEQKLAGFDAGADDYLTKPTEPVELLERVKSMLEGVAPREDVSPEDYNDGVISQDRSRFSSMSPADSGEGSVIAVVGIRGGSGTTLLAINLAFSLAQKEQKTVLLDLDIIQGHVGLYLKQNPANTVNDLLSLPQDHIRGVTENYLTPFNDQLQLLLASNDLANRTPFLHSDKTQMLVEALTAMPGRSLVVDCGYGITTVNRAVIEQADHVIVCMKPERLSIAVAREFLPQLQQSLFPHTQLQVVMINFSGQAKLPQSAIEGYLGYELAASISIKPQEMSQSVNKSVPLVQSVPDAPGTMAITQLVERLQTT